MYNTINHDGYLITLEQYITMGKRKFDHKYRMRLNPIPFEDEYLIFLILDWYGATGEFTADEKQYLKDCWDIYPDELEALIND